jgi:hypothetical protein
LLAHAEIARKPLAKIFKSLSDLAHQAREVGNLDQIPNDVSAIVQVALSSSGVIA